MCREWREKLKNIISNMTKKTNFLYAIIHITDHTGHMVCYESMPFGPGIIMLRGYYLLINYLWKGLFKACLKNVLYTPISIERVDVGMIMNNVLGISIDFMH